jgi:DNA invertase Pin-like site-specific DNA recombinase
MMRAAIYTRVSTSDQNATTQLLDLRQLAAQRGFQIVAEFTDCICGAKSRRPGLDNLLRAAHRGQFDIVLIWSFDRVARSVIHFLHVLDELNRLDVQFVSFRETIDSTGPLGRAMLVIVAAIAELERSLIRERVCAGLRRARAEGRRIGRPAVVVDRDAVLQDRRLGRSLAQIAEAHRISRTTVHRLLHTRTPAEAAVPKTL